MRKTVAICSLVRRSTSSMSTTTRRGFFRKASLWKSACKRSRSTRRLTILSAAIADTAGLNAFSHRETESDQRVLEAVSCPAGSFGDVGEAEQAQGADGVAAHDGQNRRQGAGPDPAAVLTE